LLSGRYFFCCTFRTRSRLASLTGPPRYGAHHPVEFGLSSRSACSRLSRRPSDLLQRHYNRVRFDSKAEQQATPRLYDAFRREQGDDEVCRRRRLGCHPALKLRFSEGVRIAMPPDESLLKGYSSRVTRHFGPERQSSDTDSTRRFCFSIR